VKIRARKQKRCAYPPTGRYIGNSPFLGTFEDLEIKDPENFKLPTQLRPDGARSPQAEANILGRIRAKAQGRAAFPDANVEDRQA
tara:strand:+ start:18464 stop:18718 length:255 start_codon:yes stop_codon:yes gene_type:complete